MDKMFLLHDFNNFFNIMIWRKQSILQECPVN